jgi:sterol desaturase/sphingolipid hydroxylase (fatty acid hydroxylase superfamily)
VIDFLYIASLGGAVCLGAVGWSLSEYWIHREAGHNPKLLKSVFNLFGREHVAHHGRGNYFAPSWKKLGAAVAASALLIGPAVLIAGPTVGTAFVVGFVSFYLYYELLHRLEHVHEGIGRYGRWARRHHFHHHFHNPRMNHGVTSPIWDHVFGTHEEPGVVAVPEKLAMRWLIDPATGDVHAHLSDLYALRRVPRRDAA